MPKPPRLLVAAVSLPFLWGCTAVLSQPIPEPLARPNADVRGVVLRGSESEQRIEYNSTETVEWTETTVTITGELRGQRGALSTRTFQLSDVESVLVHEVDVNRTSLLIAGMMTGLGVLAAILFTGTTTDSTILTQG